MTRKSSIAQQIANITNSVKALEILQQLKDPAAQAPTIQSITVTLSDGSTQEFVQANTQQLTSTEVLTHIRARDRSKEDYRTYRGFVEPVVTTPMSSEPHNNWSTRITHPPRIGKHCEIEGVKYNSLAAAARAINLCPDTVAKRVHSSEYPAWKFV